ncbi:MAG: DUF362 domain-containing protein [Halobacteriota archaeon]|nr:DUF362 domain-containing protein [Halobacteriota archaeon]
MGKDEDEKFIEDDGSDPLYPCCIGKGAAICFYYEDLWTESGEEEQNGKESQMPEVAIVESEGYEDVEEKVKETINLIGGRGLKLKGTVVIKPNAGSPLPIKRAANTHPSVVSAVVELVRDHASEVIVVERDAIAAPADVCLARSGIAEAVARSGGELRILDDDPKVRVNIDGKRLKEINLPKTLTEYDLLIDLPKLKTNSFTNLTLGIKNLMGLLDKSDRRKIHRMDISQALVDLLKVIKPDLTLIDGIQAMEGQGPVFGDVVDMGVLIAGKDIVATDAVASYVAGFYPEEIDTTRIAAWEGIGTCSIEDIKIVGSRIEDVRRALKRPLSTIEAMYSNVDVYMGGACKGCYDPLMVVFESFRLKGELEKVGKITVIMGRDAPIPDSFGDKTLIVGDCAEEHKEKGIFIKGCPPLLELFKFRL